MARLFLVEFIPLCRFLSVCVCVYARNLKEILVGVRNNTDDLLQIHPNRNSVPKRDITWMIIGLFESHPSTTRKPALYI